MSKTYIYQIKTFAYITCICTSPVKYARNTYISHFSHFKKRGEKMSSDIFCVTPTRNIGVSHFERSRVFTRETHVMSVRVVGDALPVQRTAKSKQKCETVARGRKDERTPPASLTSFPSWTVVVSSGCLLFSGASRAFTEAGDGKGKLPRKLLPLCCPRLLVKARAIELMRG